MWVWLMSDEMVHACVFCGVVHFVWSLCWPCIPGMHSLCSLVCAVLRREVLDKCLGEKEDQGTLQYLTLGTSVGNQAS